MGTVKYTGPVASFHCPTEATIRSLKVHFSPKQEGSGDPSPENVREIVGWDGIETTKCGKNMAIMPITAHGFETGTSIFNEVAGNTFENLQNGFRAQPASISTGIYVLLGYVFAGVTYTLSFNSTFSFNRIRIEVRDNDSFNETATKEGDGRSFYTGWKTYNSFPYTFTPNSSGYLWSCFHQNTNPTSIFTVSNIQLELGSTATSYEPYHGSTTNYEFGVLGKNKFNWNVPSSESSPASSDATTAREFTLDTYVIGMSVNNYYRQNYANWVLNPSVENGVISFSSGGASGYGIAFPIKLAAGQTYFLSGTGNGAVGATYYNEDGELISYQNGRLNKTITIPDNTATTLIGFYASASNTEFSFSNIQLELGDTATTYEPYDPNKTVYGGWVDLITGEVQQEWAKVTMEQYTKAKEMHESPDENIYSADFGLPYIYGCLMSDVKLSKCNCLEYNTTNEANTFKLRYFVNGQDGFDAARKFDVNVYSETPLDETSIRDYLANINFELYYKTTAPMNTYNLAPLEMQTFLSHNNIWSNADYVEVEYDLHETQNILARKQFIMANQPHVVKPAAAPLQNFVTDMATPVKECKVYFSPVQKGEGNPSPENVRAISWWMAIVIEQSGKNLFNALNATSNTSIWTFSEGTWSTSYVESGNSTHKWGNQIFAPGTYTFSAKFSEPGVRGLRFLCSSPTCNGTWDNTYQGYWKSMVDEEKITFSVTEPCKIGLIFLTATGHVGEAGTAYNIQLEKGSVATYYEPYSGAITPIIFPSEAGTIYGGYVDLVNGELVQTWNYIRANEKTWSNYSAYQVFYTNNLDRNVDSRDISDQLRSYTGYGWANAPDNSIISGNRNTMFIKHLGVSSNAEFKEWLDEVDPIVCYELAEPIHYTLTPTQLKTLRGANNIWAFNGGDNIEIAYWKH